MISIMLFPLPSLSLCYVPIRTGVSTQFLKHQPFSLLIYNLVLAYIIDVLGRYQPLCLLTCFRSISLSTCLQWYRTWHSQLMRTSWCTYITCPSGLEYQPIYFTALSGQVPAFCSYALTRSLALFLALYIFDYTICFYTMDCSWRYQRNKAHD